MKGVRKMINILVNIISIARMKLLMLPKAKKPDHFACIIQRNLILLKGLNIPQNVEANENNLKLH
jgi:hypothetical protein